MDILKEKIRHVQDFPKAGILFYDITTLLREPGRVPISRRQPRAAVHRCGNRRDRRNREPRLHSWRRGSGWIGAGFSPVRKPGKLPSTTVSESYALEYGSDSLEIHDDAVTPGQRVLIVDDVIATGGTAKATATLVRRLGATVHGLAFLIELVALNGRERLAGEHVFSVLKY